MITYAHYESLLQASLSIHRQKTADEVMLQVVRETGKLAQCDLTVTAVWLPGEGQFQLQSSTTLSEGLSNWLQGHVSHWIREKKQMLLVSDTRQDPFTTNVELLQYGLKCYAGVPIQDGTEVVGVIYTFWQECVPSVWDALRVIQSVADMAGVALHNAHHLAALQKERNFRQVMMQLAIHDLGSPLGRVIGFLEILLEQIAPLPAEQMRWVEIIRRSCQQMKTLIRDVLDYEQKVANEMAWEPCDLTGIIKQVMVEFEGQAQRSGYHFQLETAALPVKVMGDALLLREMVGNLISNAFKYTPANGRITVAVTSQTNKVLLSIHNTGSYITPDDQARLFQPFIRLKLNDEKQGTGLGLSLVKAIVERHQGYISVDSQMERGTVFHIHLPLVNPHLEGTSSQTMSQSIFIDKS